MKKHLTFMGIALCLGLFSLSLMNFTSGNKPVYPLTSEAALLCSLGGQDCGHTNY